MTGHDVVQPGDRLMSQGETQRCEEIWASLAPVTDPELDESITELGFVTSVTVDDSEVRIGFHLPTYWCAANFAFLMASDLHRAARGVSWVQSVTVELDDHMYADTINRGIAAGASFSDTFGDEANDELEELRQRFRQKAFQQRQETVLRHLLKLGYTPEKLVTLCMDELSSIPEHTDKERRMLSRYREIRKEWGGPSASGDKAFVTVEGSAVSPARFDQYLIELRSIRINTQFNGEICKGLLNARYAENNARVHEVRVDIPSPAARRGPALHTDQYNTGTKSPQ